MRQKRFKLWLDIIKLATLVGILAAVLMPVGCDMYHHDHPSLDDMK